MTPATELETATLVKLRQPFTSYVYVGDIRALEVLREFAKTVLREPGLSCPRDTNGDGDCADCHNKGGCPLRA